MLGTRTKQINSYGKRGRRVVDATSDTDRPTTNSKLVSIFADLPPAPVWTSVASKMKKREVITKQKPISPKVGLLKKRRLSPSLSPAKKKQLKLKATSEARIIGAKPSGSDDLTGHGIRKTDPALISDFPSRAPLSNLRLNMPGSPAVSQKLAKSRIHPKKGTPSKLKKPFSPFVDMDIMILDDEGNVVRKERRVSRTGVDVDLPHRPPSKNVQAGEFGDPESETASQPRRPKRRTARKRAVIVSDDSEPEEENSPKPAKMSRPVTQMESKISNLSLQMSKVTLNSVVEVVMPPAPYRINRQKIASSSIPPSSSPEVLNSSQHQLPISLQSSSITLHSTVLAPPSPSEDIEDSSSVDTLSQQNLVHFVPRPAPTRYSLVPSPMLKNRPLTPIRGGRSKRLFDPPPTTPTDSDLSIDFSVYGIESPSQSQDAYRSEFEVPKYLRPLLEECHQETCGPHNFSAFIESFPFDSIISRGNEDVDVRFRKIGEASYSEVFGIGDVVLKVIPLRDESETGQKFPPQEDGPAPSDAKDVRKEIIVTRAMGEVYDGFVKLLKTYVVRGRYPEVLLQLWDEYNERKGSESIRPGKNNLILFTNKSHTCCQTHLKYHRFMRSSSSQMVVLTSKRLPSITRVERAGGKQVVSFGR